jgi:8-oxo-dGTP pyrophosphatase MutT (NUDIX family)
LDSWDLGAGLVVVVSVFWKAKHGLQSRRITLAMVSRLIRRRSVRFSATAVLALQHREGLLLLRVPARGNHRPYWAPPGGVMKFDESAARNEFSSMDVERHRVRSVEDDDLIGDLRVKLPRRHLWKFMRWYHAENDVESPGTALIRELREELIDELLAEGVDLPEGVAYEIIRTMTQGVVREVTHSPRIDVFTYDDEIEVASERDEQLVATSDDELLHIRYFYIFRYDGKAEAELAKLLESLPTDRLAWVTEQEISDGHFRGERVAGHAAYLCRAERRIPHLETI